MIVFENLEAGGVSSVQYSHEIEQWLRVLLFIFSEGLVRLHLELHLLDHVAGSSRFEPGSMEVDLFVRLQFETQLG